MDTDVSEEHTASIIRVEVLGSGIVSVTQVGSRNVFTRHRKEPDLGQWEVTVNSPFKQLTSLSLQVGNGMQRKDGPF
jgi:hypothetical protein